MALSLNQWPCSLHQFPCPRINDLVLDSITLFPLDKNFWFIFNSGQGTLLACGDSIKDANGAFTFSSRTP
ncbi:hypothetical protein IF1G_10372 [Cordyceps javanica]|uniref:Uncharacterized protein n=1 Tax=Cordyceps javanica TaxID=43265 RepID=A0A545UN18_9HYPO|nr:hypothetical protein IF1G_10372 [Cordyceps javanica]